MNYTASPPYHAAGNAIPYSTPAMVYTQQGVSNDSGGIIEKVEVYVNLCLELAELML